MTERAERSEGTPMVRDMRDRALATTALALYSFMVAVGFSRVFSGSEFLADLVPVIIVGHLAGLALARVHLAIAFPVQLAIAAWVVGVVGYGDTYRFGLPTGETIEIMRADITFAGDQFPEAVAPVVYAGGWTALAALGIGITVLLADLFAFRAAARFEALVPGGVLFVVVGALGSGQDRVLTTVALILAAVLAVGALRSLQRRPARIVIGKRAPRRLRMVAGALVLGSITALVAGVVGPRLPGAASDAVWDTRRGGTDVTRIESPLVDIRSRLVDQSTREMFRVQTNAGSYWRVATLSSFDGSRWKLDRSDLSPADELPRQRPSNRLQITQQIEIGDGLRGQLVPAAPEPVEADGDDLRWSARNSTLLVADPDGLQSGDMISVVSSAPRYYPRQLDRATANNPPGITDYLALPGGLPDSVTELAAEVTADATTPYQRARAMQDWFRSEFDYSLEVQGGHGNNAIEAFLRLRVGYCEQFAGTFAAMARSVGLPARVAVGYTPGTYLEELETFSVAGRNAQFERIFDVPDRVIPADVLGQREPPDAEAHVELVRRAAASHGVATEACLRDYYRMHHAQVRPAVQALVESGELIPVRIEGWERQAYLYHQARLPRRVQARALLSPFDPVVWERTRTEQLFGFRYRIEIYVPEHARVHGYYVLPFLLGENLVARVDLKADRKARVLVVKGAYAEPSAPEETAAELAAALRELADWLGLSDVHVAPRGDLAGALSACQHTS